MLRSAARDVLIESSLVIPRRRLAGGSDASADALRAFARVVGWELTPPLTSIWNRIEVMLAELNDEPRPGDIVRDLQTVCGHTARMAATVNALLCFSGEHVFELHPIDLNALLNDSLSSVTPRLASRQVEVNKQLDPTVPPVLADTAGLRFALTTVVEAAAETSKTIDVTASCAGDGEVLINVGGNPQVRAARGITAQDSLSLRLADAVMGSLGGRIELSDGNPSRMFVISLRTAGNPSTGARNDRPSS